MNSRAQVLEADALIPIVAVVLALLVGAWLLPVAASLAHARAWPDLNAGQAVAGTVRVLSDGHAANPRGAYPRAARATMPRGGRGGSRLAGRSCYSPPAPGWAGGASSR